MEYPMAKLDKYIPTSEAQLHMIIKNDLEAIEEGLVLLQHECLLHNRCRGAS